jgi:hypothetical protein
LSSRRWGRLPRIWSFAAAGLVLVATIQAAVAGDESFNPLGDGSVTTNEDMLRDPTTGCENCIPNPPHEWDDPWYDLDWSLAFRGAYVHTSTGSYFEAIANPSLSFTHEFLRGSYAFSASAEVSRSSIEDLRLGAIRGSFAGEYRIDESTTAAGTMNLALTRASSSVPGTMPTIAVQPLVFTGDAGAEIEREFGPLVVSGRAEATRTVYGPTTMIDSSVVDNSHQNTWLLGAGLRLGYRVTPILTAFVDGSIDHQRYDEASPTYLVRLDATDYEGRVGVSANWHEILEAEASVGYGLRRFNDPMFADASSILYDAALIFRPDETLDIRGAFTTTFGAPGANTSGSARLEYAARGDIGYKVNPWLKLRATAGWRYAELIGTADTERGHNAGVGADYLLNEFTTLTADYDYSFGQSTPNPAQDQHKVTLGITFSR